MELHVLKQPGLPEASTILDDVTKSDPSPSDGMTSSSMCECAWCHKPRDRFQSVLAIRPHNVAVDGSEQSPVPVCCSQICFDHLRRAQFKRRNRGGLANGIAEMEPIMLTSGRPPYLLGTSECKQQQQHQRLQLPATVAVARSRTTVCRRVPRQSRSGKMRLIVRQAVPSPTATVETAPIGRSNTSTNATEIYGPPDGVAQNLMFPVLSSAAAQSQMITPREIISHLISSLFFRLSNVTAPLTRDHGESVESQAECTRSCPTNMLHPSQIVPIILPIFKFAPELLDILHRHGYHSRASCETFKQPMCDASTQTALSDACDVAARLNQTPKCGSYLEDGEILDLRLVRSVSPAGSTVQCEPSSHVTYPTRSYGTHCYKMVDLKTKQAKMVQLFPLCARRKPKRDKFRRI